MILTRIETDHTVVHLKNKVQKEEREITKEIEDWSEEKKNTLLLVQRY